MKEQTVIFNNIDWQTGSFREVYICYPAREQAEKLLSEAQECNLGQWGKSQPYYSKL